MKNITLCGNILERGFDMNNDVLMRVANGELGLRVVQSTGDNSPEKNDVFTRDDKGNLVLRVVLTDGGDGDKDDVLTRDAEGKLAVRIVIADGGK